MIEPGKQRVIPLVGGPLDGIAHELEKGWPVPNKMGLLHPDDENPTELHWYVVRDGKGYYKRTERVER
jgi:hypothetical protein